MGKSDGLLVPRDRLQPLPFFGGNIVKTRPWTSDIRIGRDGQPLAVGAEILDAVDGVCFRQDRYCFPARDIDAPDLGAGGINFFAVREQGFAAICPKTRGPLILRIGLGRQSLHISLTVDCCDIGLRFALLLYR